MAALLIGPLLRHVGRHTATLWVETDTPCRVRVLDAEERTFEVAGHHYALVVVTGLAEGSTTEYRVYLDGDQVWPAIGSTDPPSRIRTLQPDRPQRIAFGSCRFATEDTVAGRRRYGVDALDAYALRTAAHPDDGWPDLLLMLGDQVYADDTSRQTREKIAARRSLHRPPGKEVADFEEYTWLYHESWRDPEIRWLMSTVPVSMIFDDHDVRDDWNTSRAWRQKMQATDWWQERITGALMSYWVYQHLGNLSPEELALDPVWAKVRVAAEAGEDAAPILRAFARAADREADGAKGYRWSYSRDLGTTRLVVIDSRCGRMLDGERRSMLSDSEFDWIEERLVEADFDHLLIGTTLPWLLAPGLHAFESWNEAAAADDSRPRRARLAELVRQTADLEHWAAFGASFERLGRVIAAVAAGRRGPAPATVCVLSGDVHHSYIYEADVSALAAPDPTSSRVYQITCSPVHNWVPGVMKGVFRFFWSAPVRAVLPRFLGRRGALRPPLTWWPIGGPFFGNAISTLVLEGRSARVVMESSRDTPPERPLAVVVARDLAG